MPSNEKQDAEPPSDPTLSEDRIIDEICNLPWPELHAGEIIGVAQAYYFFSVQFRENLEIARGLWPDDRGLARLYAEECNTDNLSPWPGIAERGERLNHDEFVRRLLALAPLPEADTLSKAGAAYLAEVRAIDKLTRAQSIISYENGGLSKVFEAMLCAPCWDGLGAQAFKFFLEEHIRFDRSEQAGHGSMVRHIECTQDAAPLWTAFRDILAAAMPCASGGAAAPPQCKEPLAWTVSGKVSRPQVPAAAVL